MRGAGRKKLGDPDPSEDQPGSPDDSHQNDQENPNAASNNEEASKEDTNDSEGGWYFGSPQSLLIFFKVLPIVMEHMPRQPEKLGIMKILLKVWFYITLSL